MEEKLVEDNKYYLRFWNEFIDKMKDDFNENIVFAENKRHKIKRLLRVYINKKMNEINEKEKLSWLKFSNEYLSNLNWVYAQSCIGTQDIISVCLEEYTNMKNTIKSKKSEYFSWDDFKEIYLPEIDGFADLLGLERDAIIRNHKKCSPENHPGDDDWRFTDGVMHCISFCDSKEIREELLEKIGETAGAREIFNEIYRIWCSKVELLDGIFFPKSLEYGGKRAEPGKGEIIDIFMIGRSLDNTIVTSTVAEDYADCAWPVVVKVKQNSNVNRAELISALRDLADSLEGDFKNCYRVGLSRALRNCRLQETGYEVPENEEIRAFLFGLHKCNPGLHAEVVRRRKLLLRAMREAGWFDPNIPLNCGIEDALKKKWPELHNRVLRGELSPFEALLETGCIYIDDVHEVWTSDAKRHDVIEEQAEQIVETDADLLAELGDL